MSLIIKPDGTSYHRKHQSAFTRRLLEKRPRKPARVKAWRPAPGTTVTEAGLSQYEAELGVAALGYDRGVIVGRILGYDQQKNTFYVVGKRLSDGKAVEAQFPGRLVSANVLAARIIAGVSHLTRDAFRPEVEQR